MKVQQIRRPRSSGVFTSCPHCGADRVSIQLGQLSVLNRDRPQPKLTEFLNELWTYSMANTLVFVCTGCACMTTDPCHDAD
jgi:hypothetical protein